MSIKVYTQNGCPKCDMAINVMKGEGIEFEEVNTSNDEKALEYVRSLDVMSFPVIVKGKEEVVLSGFNPDKIKGLK